MKDDRLYWDKNMDESRFVYWHDSKGNIPHNTFKDPYFLDFLGLKSDYLENDLESAILHELEHFILELGKGFAFIECQKRMIIGRYAIFKHKGKYNSLHKLYKNIYEVWLPQSGYHPRGTVTLEIYLNNPGNTTLSELRTDVYIPVEKQSHTF